MEIILNGNAHHIDPGTSLEQLLASLPAGQGRIAVELNGEIVPRNQFPQQTLQAGDTLEIVRAIGGG